MFLKYLITVLVFMTIVTGDDVIKSDEDYIDSVIDLLWNDDSVEIGPSSEENEEEQPFFSEGVWQCGNCSNIDETKLIYSEVNDVDTNVSNESGIVQVALSLDNMSCITVNTDASDLASVRRVSGACVGARVTLAVSSAKRFTVRVYGD